MLIETFCNNQMSENEIMQFNSKWQESYEKSGYICWLLHKIYVRKDHDHFVQL